MKVPFTPGRTDASQEQTDVDSFAALEPFADGFRNYLKRQAARVAGGAVGGQGATADADGAGDDGARRRPARAGANCGQLPARRLHQTPETLTNDFFVNLLDMSTHWQPSESSEGVFEGRDRKTNEVKWTGTRADLIFGSHSQLRALAEVYACADVEGEVRE